jgi:hypothetical protein
VGRSWERSRPPDVGPKLNVIMLDAGLSSRLSLLRSGSGGSRVMMSPLVTAFTTFSTRSSTPGRGGNRLF